MSTNLRIKEISRLREEGRQARFDGKHRQNYPQQYIGSMDLIRWTEGWDDADEQLRDAAKRTTNETTD